MRPEQPEIFVAPTRGVVAGAVFLHVPIAYQPRRLVAASVVAGGLVQIEPDIDRAWRDAPPRFRDVGIPTLTPAKPRPAVVLAVGAAEEDSWHRENVWIAPCYSNKEYQSVRKGRNVFELPAAPRYGLGADGFLDFFQVTTVPLTYLETRNHGCDLTPAAFDALLTAFRACLLP